MCSLLIRDESFALPSVSEGLICDGKISSCVLQLPTDLSRLHPGEEARKLARALRRDNGAKCVDVDGCHARNAHRCHWQVESDCERREDWCGEDLEHGSRRVRCWLGRKREECTAGSRTGEFLSFKFTLG